MECPVCSEIFPVTEIENHVDRCLFSESNRTPSASVSKRTFPFLNSEKPDLKKPKVQEIPDVDTKPQASGGQQLNKDNLKSKKVEMFSSNSRFGGEMSKKKTSGVKEHVPLAERLRPVDFSDYIGQKHMVGSETVLGQLMEKKEVTSMILWGPPGCGKTSLANIIAKMTKKRGSLDTRFVKLSATSSGIADIRQAVATAMAESKNNRRTVVFMDEIHRFNKLQQDIFLPHVEAGIFILIGATTENPSFSLNSALLSRCRVFSLEKLSSKDVTQILQRAVTALEGGIIPKNQSEEKGHEEDFLIEREALDWLAEVCDGDARVALSSLELTVKSRGRGAQGVPRISLRDVKSNLEKAYSMSERESDRNQDLVAAMHKCIKDSHANGALYWLARLMASGEDPVFIGKRLIRIASEDVAFDDPDALDTAVHTMHSCQMIGMPECDVILAQCVCYLCKATKARTIDSALRRVQKIIADHKGPQPSVPMFIRDTSSQRKLQVTVGRNLVRMDDKSRNHLPAGLESTDFFVEDDDDYNTH
ncbi:ATPase WRNIP1-like [Fopius arisanus]|uniref:ATPase WRNIP1-like n=1 Tax=Fopius arisanus TaxID=64838 RepID=A0A9R1TWJ4_9HYME|nr:PREDICTED: ATPase WRNIP1-like [Fopius arisanus]